MSLAYCADCLIRLDECACGNPSGQLVYGQARAREILLQRENRCTSERTGGIEMKKRQPLKSMPLTDMQFMMEVMDKLVLDHSDPRDMKIWKTLLKLEKQKLVALSKSLRKLEKLK